MTTTRWPAWSCCPSRPGSPNIMCSQKHHRHHHHHHHHLLEVCMSTGTTTNTISIVFRTGTSIVVVVAVVVVVVEFASTASFNRPRDEHWDARICFFWASLKSDLRILEKQFCFKCFVFFKTAAPHNYDIEKCIGFRSNLSPLE